MVDTLLRNYINPFHLQLIDDDDDENSCQFQNKNFFFSFFSTLIVKVEKFKLNSFFYFISGVMGDQSRQQPEPQVPVKAKVSR